MRRKVFSVFMILLLILSACSSDADKAVLQNNEEQSQAKENLDQTGDEQNQPKENQPEENQNSSTETSLTEYPKQQKEIQSSEENSNLDQTDKEQNQLEGNPLEENQPDKNQPDKDGTVPAWQSAYLEVIYHLQDYLAPRYYYDYSISIAKNIRECNDPMDVSPFYLGLHDFDGDNILELIIGDSWNLSIFTYKDDCVEKIADLYDPKKTFWCVEEVYFKGNSIRAECSIDGGRDTINFTYLDGEYVIGFYNELLHPVDISIWGGSSIPDTLETINQIYTLDYSQIQEEEHRERFRLVNENGTWILKHNQSEAGTVLDINFDFNSILW